MGSVVIGEKTGETRQAVESAGQTGGELRVPRRAVFWMVLLALAVRVGFMLATHTYRYDLPVADDSSLGNSVGNIARSLIEGRGFSTPFGIDPTGATAMVAPAVPCICALAFWCFGIFSNTSMFWLLLFQSVVAALTTIWIVQIGERCASRKAALGAALVWAVFPWFAKWPVTWLWDMTLTAAVLTLLIAKAMQIEEDPRERRWAAFGAIGGMALLINPALATLFPVMVAWSAARVRALRRPWIKPALVSTLVCCAVIAPWLVRNYVVFRQFVFIRSNFWLEFSISNYHGSFGRGWGGRHPEMNLAERTRYAQMGEAAYIRARAQESKQHLRQHPGEFLALTAHRVVWFWDGSNMGYRPPIAWYWLPGSYVILSFLAIFALLYACLRRVRGWPIFLAAILLFPLPYYFTYGAARFRHALEPLILVLVAHFLGQAWAASRKRWLEMLDSSQKGA
jgi:4-amino-4-deoxy-L-arabinose transferase-like glycosyltransferase